MAEPIILLIEDQKSMASFLEDKLSQKTDIKIVVARNLQQAVEVIESDAKILVCLTDLNLPDAEEGATVPILRKHRITTVVLTSNYSEKIRKKMFDLQVADYVIKDGPVALEYAVNVCLTMVENADKSIWLVSKPSDNATHLRHLLNNQGFRVFLFEDLSELSKAIKGKVPDLILINQINELGEGKTLKLVQLVRYYYSSSQLPIVLTDGAENVSECIRMMKYGVNDFFNIETSTEEFYVRLRLNLLQAERYKEIEYISQTDSLTGLHNRRFFFEKAESFYQDKRLDNHFAVMLDIDFFKQVNDKHGHHVGDKAIQFVAQKIQQHFKKFLSARFGGEEFAVCGSASSAAEVIDICESLRKQIESDSYAETGVAFTISIGLCFNANGIDKAMSLSDEALYEAKESGRNKVVAI
ncbi:diguanylate cyclase [Thiomicrorhabdus sediminis]|nr:diguanylate cyclase [Thiomicrorhabdus sediminis]